MRHATDALQAVDKCHGLGGRREGRNPGVEAVVEIGGCNLLLGRRKGGGLEAQCRRGVARIAAFILRRLEAMQRKAIDQVGALRGNLNGGRVGNGGHARRMHVVAGRVRLAHRRDFLDDLERLACRRRFGRRGEGEFVRDVQLRLFRRESSDERLNLLVPRIGVENAHVPGPRVRLIALADGDVAQVTEGDEILRIEPQRRLEDRARLGHAARLVERLAVDNMPAHVPRLLREKLLADHDGLLDVPGLAKFVRQRREIATRVFVEFLLQLVGAGSAGHQSLGGGAQAGVRSG